MDTKLRLLEKKAINDPSQILHLLVAQKRAGQMIFKNSNGLEILNQCAGTHSNKFEIKNSSRIEYGQDFPSSADDNDTYRTWIFLDIVFAKKEGEKDTIKLYLQINKNAILVEKVYISDSNSIESMASRVDNLVSALSNGQGVNP